MLVKTILEAEKRVAKSGDDATAAPGILLNGERQLVLELDSVTQLVINISKFLKNAGGTNQEKVDVMRWVIHLIDDVHQPLHCIEHITEDHPAGDRSGNSCKLRGKAKNLHSLWGQFGGFLEHGRRGTGAFDHTGTHTGIVS